MYWIRTFSKRPEGNRKIKILSLFITEPISREILSTEDQIDENPILGMIAIDGNGNYITAFGRSEEIEANIMPKRWFIHGDIFQCFNFHQHRARKNRGHRLMIYHLAHMAEYGQILCFGEIPEDEFREFVVR